MIYPYPIGVLYNSNMYVLSICCKYILLIIYFIYRLAFVYYLQGQTYFDTQHYTDAFDCFGKSAEIKPNNDGYHTRR